MKIFSTLLLCLLALPAPADTLKLEKGACDMLVKHVPSPNVDYRAGVDAYGRRVAGADLNGGTETRLGPIEIPLSVELADRLHLGSGTGTGAGISTDTGTTTSSGVSSNPDIGPGGAIGRFGNEAYIGTVVVDGDAVLLNGQPLTDETEENLAILCMHANPPNVPPR